MNIELEEMTDEEEATSEQRRPGCSALTGQEREISSCISDEVGRENGKRKSLLASGANGDTVPSFPGCVFSFYPKDFHIFFFFLQVCVKIGLVTSCPSRFSRSR